MQKRSFHVLLINKTHLNSALNYCSFCENCEAIWAKKMTEVACLITGTRFVKKSRRKSEHLCEWTETLLNFFSYFFFFFLLFLPSKLFQSNEMHCVIQLKKENLKSGFLAPEFGCPNRYTLLSQTAWIRHCLKQQVK